jgi:hypothetical protein
MNAFAVRCGEGRGGRRSWLSRFPKLPSRPNLHPPWNRPCRLGPSHSWKRPSSPGLLFVALLAGLTISCVSVPQEAVVLSSLVGTQIAEHRASHEAFVRRYFARCRDVVELFLRDRWVPEYLETFVGESEVMELLTTPDEVFGEDQLERLMEEVLAVSGIGEVRAPLVIEAVSRVIGDVERGQVMLDFAEVALAEIEAQRSELLDPLDRREEEVLDYLAESYGQLELAQTQVTAYLASAQEVTRSQDEILQAMGIRDVRDDGLDHAVRLSEDLAAAAKAGDTAAEALEKMRELIGAAGSEEGNG